jgi:hypothetical protein
MPSITNPGDNTASDRKRSPLLLLSGIAGLLFIMAASLGQTGLNSDGIFLRPLEQAFGITGQSSADDGIGGSRRSVWDIDFISLLKSPQWTPAWVGDAARMLVVLGAAGIAGVFALRRLFSRRKPSRPLEGVAREARQAIDTLEHGGDFGETILLCYRNMLRTAMDSRGIVREQHITPGEFEVTLHHHGLPAAPLALLTRLFEAVRYGRRPAAPGEEQAAVRALREIVAACEGGRSYAT